MSRVPKRIKFPSSRFEREPPQPKGLKAGPWSYCRKLEIIIKLNEGSREHECVSSRNEKRDSSPTPVVALDISRKKKLIQVTMFEAKNKTDRLRDFISKRKFETKSELYFFDDG